MNKQNKGITLIALVITVIILLILAGVTITQLSRSSLFTRAEEAKRKYENEQEKEEKEIDRNINEINSYISGNRENESNWTILYSGTSKTKNIALSDSLEKYKTLAIICQDSLGTIYSNLYPITLIKETYGTLYQIAGANKYSNFTIKDSINIENSQIENLWIKYVYGL